MTKPEDLVTINKQTWCPGCGNIGLWGAFKNAAVQKGWDNTNSCLTAGIGCHGHLLNFTKITSFEGLHGRAIPLAVGIKTVNPNLSVFVFTGDGDCLGEGGNHFIHACRRNHNITVIIHNNAIYGLTTGQTTPTSPHNLKSKSTPQGNPDWPFSPLALAIASGATFVARGFATDIQKLTDLIIKANDHEGIAVIDVLQPCFALNKEFSFNFIKENVYNLDASYDPKNKAEAFKKALEWGSKQIPLGIFYQEGKPSPESQTKPVGDPIVPDISDFMNKFS